MAALTEAAQVGKREELANYITNVEAQSTPFVSLLPKGSKPNQSLIDFLVEAYPDRGHGGIMDGADVSSFTSVNRKKLQVRSQKFQEAPSVTDFASESNVAGLGMRKEMAHQKVLHLVMLKRQLEQRGLSVSDTAADDGASQPNETRGAFCWTQNAAQGYLPVDADFRTPTSSRYTGALADLSEDDFGDLIQSSYDQQKKPVALKGLVGSALKRHVSSWSNYSDDVASKTTVRTFNQTAKDRSIINVIDKLTMDAGTVDLMLSSYLATDESTGAATDYTTRSGLFINPKLWEMRYTRMPRIRDLEDRGGGPRALMDAIAAFLCKNPLGEVVVYTDS